MKVLLAGATGYLGGYILKELLKRSIETKIVIRNPEKLNVGITQSPYLEILKAEITNPEELRGKFEEVNVLISAVGITRQKDGLIYMDVDYQANKNLLEEAIKCKVKKFIYISVLNGEKLRNLRICEAKEKFADELKQSGLDYCIIRPNGFFSDMQDFFNMAVKGRVYLFGDGHYQTNPIHGEDLAIECVNRIFSDSKELKIGGPEIYTQNRIAQIALKAAGKKERISHLPDWIRRSILFIFRHFTSQKIYGPIEFFMTVMAMDMIAPQYGKHSLKKFYQELNEIRD